MEAITQGDLVVGLKVGKTTVAAVVLEWTGSEWAEKENLFESHQRSPRDAVGRIWSRLDHSRIRQVVATGSQRRVLGEPVLANIPRDAALKAALGHFYPQGDDSACEALNVIRISAGGYSVFTRDSAGRFNHSPAERCSAGTGDAIEKLCARAGFPDLESAINAAEKAEGEVPITARCSAIAQSEATHLANEGNPKEQVLRGYLVGIAGLIVAFARKFFVDGRVIVIGGVSKNRIIMSSLQEQIRHRFEVHPDSDYFEAWGAGIIAADLARQGRVSGYSTDVETIINPETKSVRTFEPLTNFKHLVTTMEEPDFDLSAWSGQVFLGIDSGSTGTKAALIEVATGRRVWDDYVPTKSDPVAAVQKIIRQMIRAVGDRADIVGLGFTGSGRQAVYSVARACFGDSIDRMVVETEISAHAAGACYYDPDNGESLTVCELGGQDAKVITVIDGVPVASDMNKACSAGTGSEVEHDALRMNTTIKEFGRWALKSNHPIDMGQTCVVFSGDIADRALSEGSTREDVAAGRYYFIAWNWLNRLVGQMGLQKKIFTLGMPVNNIALPLAIAAVTGCQVVVPPRPGATGAIGIGLLTRDHCSRAGVELDQSFDLGLFLKAEVAERTHFTCGNTSCGARCRIDTAKVEVGGHIVTVKSGGMCPLHEGGSSTKLPTEAPKPFQERRALWERLAGRLPTRIDDQTTVAVPATMGNVRILPLLSSFWAELRVNVRVIEAETGTMQDGERVCSGKDLCAPVKVAHGLAVKAAELGVDWLCFPKLVTLPRDSLKDVGSTCPLVQGSPQMDDAAINGVSLTADAKRLKVLSPVLKFGLDWPNNPEVKDVFVSMGRELGRSREECLAAFERAVQAQQDFQSACLDIGRRALEYAAEHKVPAVVVLGRLYTIHSPVINGQIPQIIQGCGVVAIPVDCYPTKDDTAFLDLVYWGEGQRILRAVVDLHSRPGVYPLMVTCYSCGPDAFLEHWLRDLANVPHCIIETDGHTGMGGFVTRIQASVFAMRRDMMSESDREPITDLTRLQKHDTGPPLVPGDPESAIILCQFGNLEPLLAAVFQSAGVRTISGPITDESILRLGRRHASGKECVPFIYVTGVLQYILTNVLPQYPDIKHFYWLMPRTTGPCRFGAYCTQHGIILDKPNSRGQMVHLFATSSDTAYDGVFGDHLRLKSCAGVMLADLLDELWCYYLPIASDPREVDETYQRVMGWAVEHLRQRPAKTRWGKVRDYVNVWGLTELIRRAICEFQKIPVDQDRADSVVTINMAGEIYVVRDAHANGDVVRKLADHNIRVRRSMVSTWIQYLTWTQGHGHKRDQFNRWSVRVKAFSQWWPFWKLDRLVAEALGRHTHTRIEPLIEAAEPYLSEAPEGEATLTIAELLKGGLAIGPQGCMVSKVAEAQLHHCPARDDIMTLYVDGDPIDPDQIASYAWALHERHGMGGIRSLPRSS
ncbi:hypothetical protein KKG41_01650 [Patescibacteria group bacterium]|nr:hypothetical protein [Patescibacteria group bacterium]MBU1890481.1 hypothetical protein [Patescibacteria group bacterium]